MRGAPARVHHLHLLLLLPAVVVGLVPDGGGDEDDPVETFDPTAETSDPPEDASPPPWSGIRKCCPPGHKMYRVQAPGCDHEVTCRIPEEQSDSDEGHLYVMRDGDWQFGFPIACPREHCPLVFLEEGGPEPYCVDKLVSTDARGRVVSERLAGKACVPRGGLGLEKMRLQASAGLGLGPSGKVVPFRKCCPLHQVYDLLTRNCIDRLDGDEPPLQDDDGPGLALRLGPSAADQDRVIAPLLKKVFDKNLTSVIEVRVGGPRCTEGQAALDVAVLHLSYDDHLVDLSGSAVLAPEFRTREGAETWHLRPGDFCVDDTRNASDALIVKVCRGDPADTCGKYGCFKKCCPHGSHFVPSYNSSTNKHVCGPHAGAALSLNPAVHLVPSNASLAAEYVLVSSAEYLDGVFERFSAKQQPHQVVFSVVIDNICPAFRYRLTRDVDGMWFFDELGRLYVPEYPPDGYPYPYCLDSAEDVDGISVLMCYPEQDPTQEEENVYLTLITIGLSISCLCMGVTLAVYSLLPALQNLHGKTLMCHVASLFVAYVLLTLTQQFTRQVFLDNDWICSILGHCVLFTFLSAFSWLNVMCFDIWRTFGATQSSLSLKRSSSNRRFRQYNLYAWGLACFITLTCVSVDQWPGNDRGMFRPQMGDGRCWFGTGPDSYGIFIFFAGPVLVMLSTNVVLFVLTARNYARIKNEINRLHNSLSPRKAKKFQADSLKLKMNGKLFLVMGVAWVLEVVSTIFPEEKAVFYLSDTANALHGVIIFLIFVVKRKVVRALGVRLGLVEPPPSYAHSAHSACPSYSLHADSRLAARGKTASNSTLFTSDFRCSGFGSAGGGGVAKTADGRVSPCVGLSPASARRQLSAEP